jgi:hypothetical protein
MICAFVDRGPDGAAFLGGVRRNEFAAALDKASVVCATSSNASLTLYRSDRSSVSCAVAAAGDDIICEEGAVLAPASDPPRTPAQGVCAVGADPLACNDAFQDLQAEQYWTDCYSAEMSEYREWLVENGHPLTVECPHGHA